MNIQAKLAFSFGGLLMGVVVFIGGGLLLRERAALRVKMAETDRDLLIQFAQTCRDAASVRDDLALVHAVGALRRHRAVTEAYYLSPDGVVAAHTDERRLGGRMDAPAETERDGDRWVLSRAVPLPDGRAGRAVIVFSQQRSAEASDRAFHDTLRRIALLSLLGILAGWVGAWMLSRHLLGPIRRLAEGTRRVSGGDLAHRLAEGRRDELGRLSEDFNAMASRLGELDQMKKDFVSNVTHELRSPLSAIESTVNMLAENLRAGRTEGTLDYFTMIRNNTARLGRFINNLLDLSRLEARRWELDLRAHPVEELLREVDDLYGPNAREKGMALRREPTPPGLTLVADADKVQQILNNLVGNALKFTPAGGTVTLSADRLAEDAPEAVRARAAGAVTASGYVRLCVSDTGPGIAAADQERVFLRFERTESVAATKAAGTGLGLAIARGWA
jgi:signal transduction histidine kinase